MQRVLSESDAVLSLDMELKTSGFHATWSSLAGVITRSVNRGRMRGGCQAGLMRQQGCMECCGVALVRTERTMAVRVVADLGAGQPASVACMCTQAEHIGCG